MIKINQYSHYSAEDFAEDPGFRKWITEPDEDSERFWNRYLQTYPDKTKEIDDARTIIGGIRAYYDSGMEKISPDEALASFHNLKQKFTSQRPIHRNWKSWLAAAGILLGISVASLIWVPKNNQEVVYSTGHGKRMELILPDSSVVQLNANSRLSYSPVRWKKQQIREAVLEGEAYFSVRRKDEEVKFVVKASDMHISVLGTEFNVRTRNERSEVVLAEGKVALSVADQQFEMIPGDFIAYSKNNHEVESKKVNTQDYISWKDGIIIFNQSLIEVCGELEALFGVQFVIDESLQNRRIQLSVPTDDLDQALEIISLVYGNEIMVIKEAQGERVLIKIPQE